MAPTMNIPIQSLYNYDHSWIIEVGLIMYYDYQEPATNNLTTDIN